MQKHKWKAYFRLARFDKPVGTFLLWYPTAWALWFANNGQPSWLLISLFLLGTIFMRSAGCVINDIADRNIDLHVTRTKLRPLTNGELSLTEALILLALFLLASLFILLLLPSSCIVFAVAAVGITSLYPFCKRFLEVPQLVLGLAFSMGIPLAYKASYHCIDSTTLLLWLINFAWIISYDTQYALGDREDDRRIGVKSTALYFGRFNILIIGILQIISHSGWLMVMKLNKLPLIFGFFWVIGGLLLCYQQRLLRQDKGFAAFKSNQWYGLILWVALAFSI